MERYFFKIRVELVEYRKSSKHIQIFIGDAHPGPLLSNQKLRHENVRNFLTRR